MASSFFDHRLLEILGVAYVHWGFCSLPRSFDLQCTGFFTITSCLRDKSRRMIEMPIALNINEIYIDLYI